MAGAPLGNQNAVGGKRNTTFTKEEIESFGEELLKWIKECDANPEKNPIHLSEWYYEIKDFTPWEWDVLRKNDCFFQYYDRAKKWLGRRTILNKSIKESYGNRFLGIYFSDLREHEKQIALEKLESAQSQVTLTLSDLAKLQEKGALSQPLTPSSGDSTTSIES